MIEQVLPGVFADAALRAKDDPRLQAFYASRHGGLIVGNDIAADDLAAWLAQEFATLPIAAERFLEHFPRMSTYCRGLQARIGYAQHGEFLIGDIPAITTHSDRPERGILQGLKLGDEQALWMPLDRNHCVALSRNGGGYLDMSAAEIDAVNQDQVIGALRVVMWHPSAQLTAFARSAMKQNAAPG